MADLEKLCGIVGLREQEAGASGTGRSHHEPAFSAREGRVLDHAEPQNVGEEVEGFVVIPNQKSDVSKRLRHDNRLSHGERKSAQNSGTRARGT